MDIAIRAYAEADFNAVASIWFKGWESTGVVLARPVTLAQLRERFPQELARGWAVYVATMGAETIGFLSLHGGTVEQLFVEPRHQGRGVGKRLLDFAKKQLPDGFTLITAVESRAGRFYEREGLTRGETMLHPEHGHKIVRYDWQP